MTMEPTQKDIAQALSEGHLRSVRRLVLMFLSLTIAGVLVALVSAWVLFSRVQNQGGQIGTLTSQQNQAAQAAQALEGQVKALGVTPVTSAPTAVAAPATASGETVSNSQVQAAVATYLSAHPAASAQSIATAVYAYCGQPSFPCKGSTGSTGATGGTGATGNTGAVGSQGSTGAAGQNASDAQVASAVAVYCNAHADCVGPAGAQGAPGAAGAPGAQGAQGDTGATGATGPAGANGSPPVSWTYKDDLGVQPTCTRAGDYTADNPTYTCS
jgi:cytoskeletal protein RodZ